MLGKIVNSLLKPFGIKITPNEEIENDIDFKDDLFNDLYKKVSGYTMTSKSDMSALYNSLKFISENRIEGDFVECGVWKGGSAMFMAYFLVHKKEYSRKIFLYDTYSGMTTPSLKDIDLDGKRAILDKVINWKPASLDEVKANLAMTKYPLENIVFVEGDVKEMLPKNLPNLVSILRLDTDWYESTLVELQQLYPKLNTNGILILDDHGHWLGAREAAEEYFSKIKEPIFLNKVNYSTRVAIKPYSQ